jgi:hypothetical protein
LTSNFQSKRLVVQTDDIVDFAEFVFTNIVHGPNNVTILQFETFVQTLIAYYRLKNLENVLFVEPDLITSALNTSRNAMDREWGVQMMGANEYSQHLRTNRKTGRITVAVLDTGVDSGHRFFRSRMVRGWNFINGDNNPYDVNGHGTHVAGIVVGSTPDLNVMIMPVKVLGNGGRGTNLTVSNGIIWATDSGANVINMSLGSQSQLSNLKRNAINHAISKNAVIVVAAGNDRIDARLYGWASSPDVITVAAVDSQNRPARFTNFGSVVDIAAPGVSILSSVPRNDFSRKQGTSMAAPFVSAAVAMYLINNPELSVDEVRSSIINYVNVPNGWNANRYGNGILDMRLAIGPSAIIPQPTPLPEPPPINSIITVTPTPIIFDMMNFNYRNAPSKQITIRNVSEQNTGRINISLTGDHARCFRINRRRINNIPTNEYFTFNITPVIRLPAKQHDANLRITAENFEKNIAVSFLVNVE